MCMNPLICVPRRRPNQEVGKPLSGGPKANRDPIAVADSVRFSTFDDAADSERTGRAPARHTGD